MCLIEALPGRARRPGAPSVLADAAAGDQSGRYAHEMLPRASSPWLDTGRCDGCAIVVRVHMVRGALDEDEPAFLRVLADLVDLDGHPVLGAPYSGAKVLVGRAAERDAEHDAAFMHLVDGRKDGQAEPSGVREPADTARRDEPPALGLVQLLHLGLPGR